MSELIKISIPGMNCGACVSAIEKVLDDEISVIRSEVDLATKSALVESNVPFSVLNKAIKAAGSDVSKSL